MHKVVSQIDLLLRAIASRTADTNADVDDEYEKEKREYKILQLSQLALKLFGDDKDAKDDKDEDGDSEA